MKITSRNLEATYSTPPVLLTRVSVQVGLDVRLNAERGPFTVFAPTDAAFNEFLEQFGGGSGRKAIIRLKRKGKLQEVRKCSQKA